MKDCLVEVYNQSSDLGPKVPVVFTLFNGDKVTEHMYAMIAVDTVFFSEALGVNFASAHIEWGDIVDIWSSSGSGLAAEWSNVMREVAVYHPQWYYTGWEWEGDD